MRFLTVLFILTNFIGSAGWSAEQPENNARDPYFRCGTPRSPLYAGADANDAVNLQLITEYKKLASKPTDMRAILAVQSAKKNGVKTIYYPVLLSSRGASRQNHCELPPFRIKFISDSDSKTIFEKVSGRGVATETPEFLQAMYNEFLQAKLPPVDPNAKAEVRGIFANLGDDVKFVTHCGQPKDYFQVGGKTPDEQSLHLLSEYYIYQLLGQLNMSVEATRLARIAYINADGKAVFSGLNWGFFREPPTSLAKRCGLSTKPPRNQQPGFNNAQKDEISAFEADFVSQFVYNTDYGLGGHNMNLLYDSAGKQFYGPYDFDLVGVYSDVLVRGGPAEGLPTFLRTLRDANFTHVKTVVAKVLETRPAMQSIVENSLLSDARKTVFLNWLKLYDDELAKFVVNPQAGQNAQRQR